MSFRNWLLAAAAAAGVDYSTLALEWVELKPRAVVVYADTPPAHVWFVEKGFVSVMSQARNGRSTEIAYIGNRGFFPVQTLLTDNALGISFVTRKPTLAYRAPVEIVRHAGHSVPTLRKLFRDAALAALELMAITTACNQLCGAEEHIVRRLLAMTRDDPRLDITEDEMREMLDLSRSTVSLTYAALKEAGLVKLGRGWIEILNRAGIERLACEHYQEIQDVRVRLKMDRA